MTIECVGEAVIQSHMVVTVVVLMGLEEVMVARWVGDMVDMEDMVVAMVVTETMEEIMVEVQGFMLAMVDMGMVSDLVGPCMVVLLGMGLAVMEPLVVMAVLLRMAVVGGDMEVGMMGLKTMEVLALLQDMVVAKDMVPVLLEVLEAMAAAAAKDMVTETLRPEGSIHIGSKTSTSSQLCRCVRQGWKSAC